MSALRVNQHKAPLNSPDHNNNDHAFFSLMGLSFSGFRVSRLCESCCQNSRPFHLPKPEMSIFPKYLTASSYTTISCFATSGVSKQGIPTSCLHNCQNSKTRHVQQKDNFYRNFSPFPFGVPDFAILRVLM
jgi:hypothetical protein